VGATGTALGADFFGCVFLIWLTFFDLDIVFLFTDRIDYSVRPAGYILDQI
jgi:hypothetical protein